MDNQDQVREFLTSRRARISPAQAGLPEHGRRRVAGLRRTEVATLAGVSVEYYAKLERGTLGGVSASVLDALARALQLDDAEREHLFHLAHAADGTSAAMRPRRRCRRWEPSPSLQWSLDAITAPAIVRNGRLDLLAANHLGQAMHQALHETTPHGDLPNFLRFTFLHPDAAAGFYRDWPLAADTNVAILRTEAGRDPHNKDLHDLVGELSTRSEDFRRRWGHHDVRYHGAGTKAFHHDAVGDLDLAYQSFALVAEPGLTMTVYTGEPASPTADALTLLASWTTHTPSPTPNAPTDPAVPAPRSGDPS